MGTANRRATRIGIHPAADTPGSENLWHSRSFGLFFVDRPIAAAVAGTFYIAMPVPLHE